MIVHKRENHGQVRAKILSFARDDLLSEPRDDENGLCLEIRATGAFELLRALKLDPATRFAYFIDLTAVDYSTYSEPKPERFAVVYTVLSPSLGVRLQITTYVPDSHPQIRSVASIYAGADWCEREVFDLYGIRFAGHPDLKRILMPDDFDGHPLRKDYPLRGRGERASFPVYEASEGHDRNF
jgi:NADH-quinone oxidoreductase subunit C